MQTCRACKQEIRWLELGGHAQMVDAEAVELDRLDGLPGALYGMIALPPDIYRPTFVVSQYTTLGDLRDALIFRAHRANCPARGREKKELTHLAN